MEVTILATKSCNHCGLVERELSECDIPYEVRYFDDHPEWIDQFDLHMSPNVLLDDEVVFRATDDHRVPSEAEVEAIRQRVE